MESFLNAAFARLDSTIALHRAYYRNPSMSIAVTDRQATLHLAHYGLANLAANAPVNNRTLFEIGSIGKVFTAIAILQAQEAGLLDVQDPVTRHLPWFHVPSKHEPIRLHHLLTHSAGIISGTDASTDPLGEVFALRENESANPPGKTYYYSNLGYKALGLVLEAVYQKPYAQIIEEGIFAPLGMKDSAAVLTHAVQPRLAPGYLPLYDDRPAHRSFPLVPAPWLETNSGDGCIASTAEDMARFARMLLNQGLATDVRILNQDSYRQLTTRWINVEGEDAYGYGLIMFSVDGIHYLGHGGDMPGYEAALFLDCDHHLGVIVLMATPHVPRLALYALGLARAGLTRKPLPERRLLPQPERTENAADYAGVYHNGDQTLAFRAEGDGLCLESDGHAIPLERLGDDQFFTPHTGFNYYPFNFLREEGRVVEVCHGPDWLANEHYRGPLEFAFPAEWRAYTGHYRSYNPWMSNFRVINRKGRLLMAWPDGREVSLTPVGQHRFCLEDEKGSPERLSFDWIANGQALQAHYSGCRYDRFFTE
jgi:CubicO group peptidase (beta-lactamase class C family)